MLDSQLLEEKVEYYSEYKNTVVFTNNKKIYNLMSKVMNEKNDTLTSYYLNTFQSDRFEAKIKEISDDSLIITIFSPLDFNEYTWLCDFLRENNKIYCTAFPYNKKFHFSNIYSYKWKNSCPKCFISELISSLRSTGKFYSMPTFQTVNERSYYELSNGLYIAAGNIDAKQSNLKHNAYLYNRYGNRAKTKLKKNRLVKTYGVPIRIKNKEYYIVNVNGFIKKANL